MIFLFLVSLIVAKAAADHARTEESAASYFNKSTSSFVKIIETEDLRIRDPIYEYPAVIFVGKENGEILRCLQEDPEECQVFYQTGSKVHSLLVTGQHLFAGLYNHLILRCDLYKVGSCTTFHTGFSETLSLSCSGGYLYVSQYSPSTILRCELNQPNSCQPLHKMTASYMWAFSHFGKYIYAGQENGKILRCSTRADNSCAYMYDFATPIRGFTNVGDNIYAVTYNGKLWNCSRRSDDAIDKCQSTSLQITSPTDIASFNGHFYVVNSMGLHKVCISTNDTCFSCAQYSKPGATAVAIAYKTFQMQNRYKDEQIACIWQSNYKCPPFVTYYGSEERDMFEVHVKNGRLYNSHGHLVDTSRANVGRSGRAAIFVMGPDGKLLVSNAHLRELLHTSSLLAGNPVAGAGEMEVNNGVILNITACDDHYQPDMGLNRQVVESLRAQGYTNKIDLKSCVDEGYDHLEPNNVQ